MSREAIVACALADGLFTVCEIGYRDGGGSSIQRWGEGSGRLFDLASLTKLFTTSAILALIDQGRLSLLSSVTSLLPLESDFLNRRLQSVSILHLLTHHSTLPAWYPFYVHRELPFFEVLQIALSGVKPTIGMCYSDLNYLLLASVIEEITQEPLESAIRRLVLDPLALGETTYRPDPAICVPTEWGNRIERQMVTDRGLSFTGWRDERRAIKGESDDGNAFYYFGGVAGHAGLFSTTDDLLAFATRLLTDFMTEELKGKVFTDWGDGRGLGWHQSELFPGNGWGHTGFTGTYLAVNPADGRALSILTNRLHVPNPQSIHEFRIAVAQTYLGA